MPSLLSSLAGGVALIVVGSLVLFRFAARDAAQSTAFPALAALICYASLAILERHGGDVIAIHLAIFLISAFICGLFLRAREKSNGRSGSFHWAPALIVVFFVLLIIVDSIFILLAERGLTPLMSAILLPEADRRTVSSVFPGTVSHDFQEKEALYNEYLKQQEQQRQRGWRIRKGWLGQAVANEPAVFQIAARTRAGDPLADASIVGHFLRPADSRLDQAFTMQEIEPGVYQATLHMPAAGAWDLVLTLQKNGQIHEIRASTSVLAR